MIVRHRPTPRHLQEVLLRRRHGMPADRARLLAELAFGELRQ